MDEYSVCLQLKLIEYKIKMYGTDRMLTNIASIAKLHVEM